jgi:hypothetical protein
MLEISIARFGRRFGKYGFRRASDDRRDLQAAPRAVSPASVMRDGLAQGL